ncbi:hypothetical protein CFC21_023576 [Triticum aestivum]|uniref:Uncharacterized protein n=3 Tax=Triticum TaxID=4564 RepID=A0A9R1PR22_TRITD|nr:uncharacterized protein At3g27210-like isoform X1 [Triticum dicoccoides]XP_037485378.1 uncharacterized protein At3g27210-like isoform X2 [Triticum dicoccoides]XP_044324219.1 uncharacterized protein At3g27210-like isoform X1 [Triticum aestivum]XP_044324220.1 uncharacterized protein At3g27210-like isoform X2 [Triticum aestivum]XP_044324221.1 uncharacterized protein At3g27210-like isoform X3 [Triticum aestivum]VAH47182.1 unnamed protein product [Triticum turgidum subsp. durum]KAF7008932.1 hyp
MRFRIRKKPASAPPDASSTAAVPDTAAGGGGRATIVASPDRYGTENVLIVTPGGSRDESFFEARPWLDSDSEDDFQSVRGDFTPSRGSTPDHQMQTSFAARISADIPSLTEKKQRLLELLQEKQQYDDEHDATTDVGSETGNSIHAEEHLNSSWKVEKAKKPAKPGCFACSAWKLSFKCCRKKKKEHKDL